MTGLSDVVLTPLMPLRLASASERRHRILARLGQQYGFTFTIEPADVDETPSRTLRPAEFAEELALRKAKHAVEASQLGTIIGADTIVVLNEEILGKPTDEQHARDMLSSLSGSTHEVITGVALVHPRSGVDRVAVETTRVTMRKLSEAEIEAYVETGESFGKAGSYAIQERADRFVTNLEGSYDNVVGFPSELFVDMLGRFCDAVRDADAA